MVAIVSGCVTKSELDNVYGTFLQDTANKGELLFPAFFVCDCVPQFKFDNAYGRRRKLPDGSVLAMPLPPGSMRAPSPSSTTSTDADARSPLAPCVSPTVIGCVTKPELDHVYGCRHSPDAILRATACRTWLTRRAPLPSLFVGD